MDDWSISLNQASGCRRSMGALVIRIVSQYRRVSFNFGFFADCCGPITIKSNRNKNGISLRDSLVTEGALVLRVGALLAHHAMRTRVGHHTSRCVFADSAFHRFLLADHLEESRVNAC